MNRPFPDFRPHPLLRGGHRQTLAGAFWPRGRVDYQAEQHRIALPDGDQVVLHDDCPADWKNGERCVLLVHGLGGCHSSPYMVRLVTKLKAAGRRVFRLDMRGCGAGLRLAQRPGHAGHQRTWRRRYRSDRGNASVAGDGGRVFVGRKFGIEIGRRMGRQPGRELDSVMAVAPADRFACGEFRKILAYPLIAFTIVRLCSRCCVKFGSGASSFRHSKRFRYSLFRTRFLNLTIVSRQF